jgi:NAD-dependent DNA ligase
MARQNECSDLAVVAEVMEVDDAFRGKRFSVTGHVGVTRDRFVELVEKAGGVFDKTPTYGTTYLVTNSDWTQGSIVGTKSNKLRKAEQLGVKIINEKRFFEMLISSGKVCADEWA